MNNCIFIGRLTKDVTSSKAGETDVARYTIAVDRRNVKAGAEVTADFINCVAYGKSAEFAAKYLKKGMKVAVTTHVQTGSYTNKEGQKVFTTDFVIDSQEFVEPKKDTADTAPAAPVEEDDDELPFA